MWLQTKYRKNWGRAKNAFERVLWLVFLEEYSISRADEFDRRNRLNFSRRMELVIGNSKSVEVLN